MADHVVGFATRSTCASVALPIVLGNPIKVTPRCCTDDCTNKRSAHDAHPMMHSSSDSRTSTIKVYCYIYVIKRFAFQTRLRDLLQTPS